MYSLQAWPTHFICLTQVANDLHNIYRQAVNDCSGSSFRFSLAFKNISKNHIIVANFFLKQFVTTLKISTNIAIPLKNYKIFN